MAILHVLADNHPTLRLIAKPIDEITPAIEKLASDMIETLASASGVGLAAPQVGKSLRLIVIGNHLEPKDADPPPFPLYVILNPVVAPIGDDREEDTEGCLSVPGWYGPVTRYCTVRLTGRTIAGKPFNKIFRGFPARVAQHEVDHLNGILFTDYIDDPTLLRYLPREQEDYE